MNKRINDSDNVNMKCVNSKFLNVDRIAVFFNDSGIYREQIITKNDEIIFLDCGYQQTLSGFSVLDIEKPETYTKCYEFSPELCKKIYKYEPKLNI